MSAAATPQVTTTYDNGISLSPIDDQKLILAQIASNTKSAAVAAGVEAILAKLPTKQYTGAPSNYAVATADGTVFTLAAGEVGFIQNLDSADALAVKKGATATTSSFSFILAPGAAADDGKGGFVIIDDWVGVVSVATMTGTARYMAWKQAP